MGEKQFFCKNNNSKESSRRIVYYISKFFSIVDREGFGGVLYRIYYRYLIGHHWNFLIKKKMWHYTYRQPPIIIYQMGKVGSKTIKLSLEKAYQGAKFIPPILHSHLLTNLDDIKSETARQFGREGENLGVLKEAYQLSRIITANPDFRWNVISLVRDPVARNIAAFFHNLPLILPDWKYYSYNDKLDVQGLQRIFLEAKFLHTTPEFWFDHQLKPVFDIDVFNDPFPRQKGYQIYRSAKANLLLIRLEDLDRVAAQAMGEFLGLRDFKMYNDNLGEDKEYAGVYKEFKSEKLPAQYIDGIYKSKMAVHFYSQAELNNFKERWMGEFHRQNDDIQGE